MASSSAVFRKNFVPPTLPPKVSGAIKGEVVVAVDSALWNANSAAARATKPLPSPCIRLLWWGEAGRGTLFRPHPCADDHEFAIRSANSAAATMGTTAVAVRQDIEPLAGDAGFNRVAFPVCCSRPHFLAYLQDMKTISFDVFDSTERIALGTASLPTAALIDGAGRTDEFLSIVNDESVVIGRLHVSISACISSSCCNHT